MMRDQLVGYLLDGLDAEERAEVERTLASDASARRELQTLRRCLDPLAADEKLLSAPASLATRTCEMVFAATPAAASQRAAMLARSETALNGTASGQILATERSAEPLRMSAAPQGGMLRRNWRMIDTLIALGAIAAAALLFFPALVQSRFLAQMDACQDNLRATGVALGNYSQNQVQAGFFPVIPRSGNAAVAGIYAVRLMENGYLDSSRSLVCPSSPLAQSGERLVVPSSAELMKATGEQLGNYQRTMGGSYGYALGHVARVGNTLWYRPAGPATNAINRWFPLLSDAYDPQAGGPNSRNHGGCGQNVLFADGRVGYLSSCRMEDKVDDEDVVDENIFRNARNDIAAGVHPFDAVLGGSSASPWQRIEPVRLQPIPDATPRR
jgi:hypothetical protein